MDDVLDRQTEGFSQGQRTKTAIARALVHDPKNVILDEPTNGLDVMTTRGLRDFLRQLRGEGRCVIFSSHIMQEVAALCDRIVVIAQGKVMAAGHRRMNCARRPARTTSRTPSSRRSDRKRDCTHECLDHRLGQGAARDLVPRPPRPPHLVLRC